MRYWTSILSLLVMLNSTGQERFFTYLEGWRNYGLFENEDGYLSYGLETDNEGYNQIIFSDIDILGQEESTVVFEIDTADFVEVLKVNSVIQVPSGSYISAGYLRGNNSDIVQGMLSIHNESLVPAEQITFYEFGDQSTLLHSVCGSHIEGQLILTSDINDFDSAPRTGVTEVDSEGNIIWHQEFVSESDAVLDWLLPSHILPTPDGGYLLTALDLTAPNNSFDVEHHATLIKLDSVGEVEWRIYPDDPDYWSEPGWPVLLDDGSVFFSWSDTYTVVPTIDNSNPNNTIHSVIIDLTDGSISNEQEYSAYLPTTNTEPTLGHQYLPTQTQMLSDGNILISGYDLSRAFFMNISPTGEYIWHRLFYNPEQNGEPLPIGQSARFMIKGTRETSDGGFICGGEFTANPGNDIWPFGIQSAFAMKLDSFGCLEEGCQLVSLSEDEIGSLMVYPNPTTGLIEIHLPEGAYEGQLEVLTLHGELLRTESIKGPIHRSNLGDFARGIYLLRLLTDEGIYFSKVQKE